MIETKASYYKEVNKIEKETYVSESSSTRLFMKNKNKKIKELNLQVSFIFKLTKI